jgi:hypothetical protein
MWVWIVGAGVAAGIAVVELRSWRKPDRPVDLAGRLRRGRGITEGRAGRYDRT